MTNLRSITGLSNRTLFRATPWILAAGVLVSGPSAPSAAAGGAIEGFVSITTPGAPSIQSGAYPARRVNATSRATMELSRVVVFLKDPPAGAMVPIQHARMTQEDESFAPGVVAITRGSTVDFPNADPYFHNVFSLSRGATFDLGRYRRGDSRSRVFTQSGLVKVYCHLHSHMAASILVFDHPYFAMPSPSGTFALRDLPPGTYELAAWHDRVGESVRQVHVERGQTARVEFSLPVDIQ